MKRFSNLLQNKLNIAGIFLLAALVGTTYYIQENSNRIKKIANFESGMQTCFARVNQTYTAKLIAETTSQYLTQNFQNLTEECFAEGILNVEESFKVELAAVAKKLSTLASNVHWFHEDILSPGSAKVMANETEGRDVGSRFEKIESTKDEILENIDQYKSELSGTLNNQKNFFYVASTLLIILMISEFMSTTRKRLANQLRENEAQAELLDNGGVVSVKVGEIIRSALEQNDLINCSKLFSNYYAEKNVDKIPGKGKVYLDALITPLETDTPKVFEKIDKIWNDDSIGVSIDKSEDKMLLDLNLEHMCSAVVDMLAEKLFSQGVQLDIKIPENLMVKARQEELEQILYHLMNYSINAVQSDVGEKSITIGAHRLGDITAFDLTCSGEGFDEQILKQRAGLIQSNLELGIDLQICHTLLEEIDAKIQLDNKLNQAGEVIGGRVKIIFRSADNNIRLVDLKKGNKKEIQAMITAHSNSAIN